MKIKLFAGLLTVLLLVAGCTPAAEDDTLVDDPVATDGVTATDTVGLDDDPFTGFDTDTDGLVSAEEYDAGVGNYDTDLVFDDIDEDADGFISEDEFGVYGTDFGL